MSQCAQRRYAAPVDHAGTETMFRRVKEISPDHLYARRWPFFAGRPETRIVVDRFEVRWPLLLRRQQIEKTRYFILRHRLRDELEIQRLPQRYIESTNFIRLHGLSGIELLDGLSRNRF